MYMNAPAKSGLKYSCLTDSLLAVRPRHGSTTVALVGDRSTAAQDATNLCKSTVLLR